MNDAAELDLRRKWTLRAHGRRVVFVKRARERTSHVLMKAFLWALYLPEYPDLSVEVAVGDRYKPDVVCLGPRGQPRFWGEAGQVGAAKVRNLVRRYPATHFALAKWRTPLAPFEALVQRALAATARSAPFDLLRFAEDSGQRFVSADGDIEVDFSDLEWRRFDPPRA